MADMGFLPDVRRILDQTNAKRQTLLFSATLDGAIDALVREYQTNPVVHEMPDDETGDVVHHFWVSERPERAQLAAEIIERTGPTVVFSRTRHGSDRIAKQLGNAGVKAAAIHGNRSQAQRERALEAFHRGDVQALVATDVAARGIHVEGVLGVVHFDLPQDHKDYIHRSGRTGRAGMTGTVVTLIDKGQRKDAVKIKNKAGVDAEIGEPDVLSLPEGPQQAFRPSRPQGAPASRANSPRRASNAVAQAARRATRLDVPPDRPAQPIARRGSAKGGPQRLPAKGRQHPRQAHPWRQAGPLGRRPVPHRAPGAHRAHRASSAAGGQSADPAVQAPGPHRAAPRWPTCPPAPWSSKASAIDAAERRSQPGRATPARLRRDRAPGPSCRQGGQGRLFAQQGFHATSAEAATPDRTRSPVRRQEGPRRLSDVRSSRPSLDIAASLEGEPDLDGRLGALWSGRPQGQARELARGRRLHAVRAPGTKKRRSGKPRPPAAKRRG